MKQDRLFTAIGGVNTELLERSEYMQRTKKPNAWLKWGLSAAACIIVVFSLLVVPRILCKPPKSGKID